MAAPLPDLPATFSHRSLISVGECGDDSGDEASSMAVGSAIGVSRATGGRREPLPLLFVTTTVLYSPQRCAPLG